MLASLATTSLRRSLIPHIYSPSTAAWIPLPDSSSVDAPFRRSGLIRVLSWNIDFSIPAHYDRTAAALDYLSSLMTSTITVTANSIAPLHDTAPIVLMFQEMTPKSHAAILFHPWIRAHFAVSDKAPSRRQSYYTLLLVDRRLSTVNWFRVPFKTSRYGRDVLGVDILIEDGSTEKEGTEAVAKGKTQCVRFCTTHLESLGEPTGFELRPKQLAIISGLLKEQGEVEIVGGMVGGDMNAISDIDRVSHKNADVDLRDVWEDHIESFGPSRSSIAARDEDLTLGRAEGHTWGYQTRNNRWPPKRFDKFFYTGDLRTVALEEAEDSSGNVGRLGVDLRTKDGDWVSDHFGIAVGVKVSGTEGV